MAKKKQHRADFRKNRTPRARAGDLTRNYEGDAMGDAAHVERIGKSEQTRRRTVRTVTSEGGDEQVLEVDLSTCRPGRVLRVHGLSSTVQADDDAIFQCATRRLLKTLSTDQRHVVAAGDRVQFRPSGGTEGIIERIEPRRGVLSRASRGRQHIIVANVDQIIIVTSAAEPYLKPHLIDRYLVTAEKTGIRPLLCINKIDLIDPAELVPLVSVYAQMGYEVLLTSAEREIGIERIRRRLVGRQSVFTGQSGVGKSSLLNAVEPGLAQRVGVVSTESQKGRHTTTTASLFPLACGGYVVDTPGLRQFQLWDIVPEEVGGYYRDLRPFASLCKFPDCTHSHEDACAVKGAVADGWLDARRYESFLHMYAGEMEG